MTAAIFIAAAGILLFLLFFASEKLCSRFLAEEESIKSRCRLFEATVLDTHFESIKDERGKSRNTQVMILQFRLEEEKRTVVHRYTYPFQGKYTRGDTVRLYYREGTQSDIALLDTDNPFNNTVSSLRKIRIGFAVLGGICIVQSVILGICSHAMLKF
ncbi:MAG: hypothetical protein ACI4KF_01695 [Huintestinicola sp.]